MKIKHILTAVALITAGSATAARHNISGTVTADGKPAQGIAVSDGLQIVKTDKNGRYEMQSLKEDGTVFVITPSGYTTNLKDGLQPAFWALLDKDIKKQETHNFDLISENQDNFTVLFPTDIHIVNSDERNDMYKYEHIALPAMREIVAPYKNEGPVYAMNLGDTSHDVFWYANDMKLDKVRDYLALLGFPAPMYSVSGNHDNDGAITGDDTDARAAWLYRQVFGPANYSVNIGNTHWIMLDDVIYKNNPPANPTELGIKGDRKYDGGLTPGQIEWIKNDIAPVPDSMQIFIGCHIPVIFNRNHGTLFADPGQVAELDKIFSRFPEVTIVSGHAHRNLYLNDKKYPRFKQHVFVATSGSIWNTAPGHQLLGNDGADAGVWLGRFSKGNKPEIKFHGYTNGNGMFRAYDLNAVGKYYKNDKGIALQKKIYPNRVDYSDRKFADNVMVNFWADRDDLKLEMTQNGQPLEVTKVTDCEDPLYNIAVYVPAVMTSPKYKKSHDNIKNTHMYLAKATDSTSPVIVTVRDADGNVVASETVVRPKKFDKDMR